MLLSSVFIFVNFVLGGHFSWILTTWVLILFSQVCVDTASLLAIAECLSEKPKGHLAFPLYVPK